MDALFNKLIDVEKKLHLSANRQNINFLREVLHEDFFEFGRSGGRQIRPILYPYLLMNSLKQFIQKIIIARY